jgi:hypothetical protein
MKQVRIQCIFRSENVRKHKKKVSGSNPVLVCSPKRKFDEIEEKTAEEFFRHFAEGSNLALV